MSEVAVYNLQGEKVSDIKLSKSLFGAEVNMSLITQALYVYSQNQREFNANTKIRGEVRGGGRKPWRQKGTGRARQGSTRSAQWRGGAMVHGPRSVDRQAKKLTKKMRENALRSILSLRAQENRIYILDTIAMEKPNTKSAFKGLSKVVTHQKPVIISPDAGSHFNSSVMNIPKWKTVFIDNINTYEIASCDVVVLPKESLQILENRYGKPAKKESVKTISQEVPKQETAPKKKTATRPSKVKKVESDNK
jgi:large subunit ribosomal protein L4